MPKVLLLFNKISFLIEEMQKKGVFLNTLTFCRVKKRSIALFFK